jgi:hypothetical protein
MNKKIQFDPKESFVLGLIKSPSSATKNIPEWFKKDTLFSNGENNIVSAFKNNSFGTYKLCIPIVDALTSGYIITLSAAVLVTNDSPVAGEYIPKINWNVDWSPLDVKPNSALLNHPVPTAHNNTFFRWITYWGIKTPKNYSLLVTHPHNRYDLPFTTMTAIIDTDKHPNSLEIAFFIKDNFEGLIDEGTPIAQILPFKRESWESKELKYSEKTKNYSLNSSKIDFIRTYKNRFWSKKVYR